MANSDETSAWQWAQDQAAEYEASGGTRANTLFDTGIPIIVMTTIGCKTGATRKVPLMRVEHEGEYAVIASKGGNPTNPAWFHNLIADPKVTIQDGPEPNAYTVRLVSGAERTEWFDRGVEVYPDYRDYQNAATQHDREIPVFVATRVA